MKKLVSIIILCLACISGLEAQHIWKPIGNQGIFMGVGPGGSLYSYYGSNYGPSIIRSQDEGDTWQVVLGYETGFDCNFNWHCFSVTPEGRIFVFESYPYRAFYSDDNGDTWQQTAAAPLVYEETAEHLYASDNNTVVGVTDNNHVFWTTDGGATWDTIHLAFVEEGENISDLLVSEDGEVYVSVWYYTGSNLGIYHSTISDMNNWELVAFEGIGVKDMEFDPEGNVVCGVYYGGEFSGFEHIPGFYAFFANSIGVSDSGVVYKRNVTENDMAVLAYSLDHGETFTEIGEELELEPPIPGGDDGYLCKGYDNRLYFEGHGFYHKSICNADYIPEQPAFAPLGAEWYFNVSTFMNSPITYYRMAVEGDTIIQGHHCSVITRPFFGLNGDKQYVYEDNRKVYWYNQTLQDFTTLYDFDSNEGDTWICEVDSCAFEIQVQSVEEYTWEGHTYRVQHVAAIGGGEYYNSFYYVGSGTIIEGIGDIYGLFPYSGACIGEIYDGQYPDYLRCYLVDGEMLYHYGSYDCDQQAYCWDGTVADAYAGGDGTAESPYRIATAEQLALLAQQTNAGTGGDAYYELTTNINLQRCDGGMNQWVSIGTADNMFMGHFNGNGNYILNVNQYIEPGNGLSVGGLFGFTDRAEISNVQLVQCSIRGQGRYVGGLVGYAGMTDITNCSINQSSVKSEAWGVAGGLVGCADVPFGMGAYVTDIEPYYITNCLTDIATVIEGSDCAGGIVGQVNKDDGRNPCVITDCTVRNRNYMNGWSVTSGGDAGGIVGYFRNGTITGCLNQFEVYGGEYGAGGIAGEANMATIENCTNEGRVEGTFACGGIVGRSAPEAGVFLNVYSCVNEGNIDCVNAENYQFAGGIVGSRASMVMRCANKGNVTGYTDYGTMLGGIVGGNGGTIANCYNRGTVRADIEEPDEHLSYVFVGGIVGGPDLRVFNVYATNAVMAPECTLPENTITGFGQIVGYETDVTHYLNGYWHEYTHPANGHPDYPDLPGSSGFWRSYDSIFLMEPQYGTTDLLEALNFGAAVVLDSVPEYPYLCTWVADEGGTNTGFPVFGPLPGTGGDFQSGDLLYTVISTNPPQVSVAGHVDGEDAQGFLFIPEMVTYEGVAYTVTEIGNLAFRFCSGLEGVLEIPETVKIIGEQAFYKCSGFTRLVLPEGLLEIHEFAFGDCTGLTGTLDFPSTVTHIKFDAFANCTGFSGDLILPNSVVEVGNTNYPPYMNMPESVATFADCFDHLVLSQALDTIGYRCFAGCSRLTGDLVMPEGLKTIEGYAFAGCSGLTSLTLNDSLDYIGPYAFAECTGITGILSIPEAINVGSWAFADCTSIEGLVLPHDFTAVSYEMQDIGYVFDGCSGLTELTIPEGWTTIVKSEFSRCGNLTHVSLPESLTKIETNAFKECTNLEGINLPEGVTEIGSGAFMECRSLTQIELPTSLRTLGNQTFARCTSLAGDMVIPDLVQRIELKTFDSCYMLQSVVFGDSINYIVELAFENTNLSSLVLKAMTPPELRRMTTPNAWHFPADIPIIVPCGALEAYQDSEDWSNFTNITEDCGNGLIEFHGSEWYYEIVDEYGNVTYQHLEYAADTTVNHKDVQIIIRTNTLYDKGEHQEVTHEYLYVEDNIVYWWNSELEEFTVLYDLGAQQGDSWVIKVGTETLTMHVDAVEQYYYEGQSLRMLRVSDENDLFDGNIVCSIGHLSSFFPERLMTRGKDYRVHGLRCYWNYGNLAFTVNRDDCDAIYANLHNGIEEDGPSTGSGAFVVYPNPTHGVLFVQTLRATSLQAETVYRITNMMGQTLMTGKITAETQQIDVSILPQGMYFITVGDGTGKFVVEK